MIFNDNTGGTDNSPVSVSDLPEWFYDGNYIGISDPNTDTIVALEQAVKRALAFYALNQNMELSSVYELYYLDDNLNSNLYNQKSHWIADFQSELENFSYSIENVYYTKYNEVIVGINVCTDTASNNNLNVNGSFMYHYDFIDDNVEYGEKQYLSISMNKGFLEKLDWVSTIVNNHTKKISYLNELPKKLKHAIYSLEDYGKTNDRMVYTENKYGLWDCYLDTFLQAISNFESKKITVKNTSQHISEEKNESFGDKTQNIVRIVTKTQVMVLLRALTLKNNNLYADWEVVEK